MIFLILLKFLTLFFIRTISEQTVQWTLDVTTITAKPLIRTVSESWNNDPSKNQVFHYKTHFGIIIKQGTTFSLTLESSSTIENLFFYCLAESPSGTFNMLDLSGEMSSIKNVTANFDCVPMVSVSHNVPVEMKITTQNWVILPIFDTKNVTILTSQEAEFEFYNNVKIYGFVENYYTQMLLSLNDIYDIEEAGYSLYLGLQNQVDVIEYYDYLSGVNTYKNKSNEFPLHSMERTTMFIRPERCYEQFFEGYAEEMLTSLFNNLCSNNDTLCNLIEIQNTSPCSNTYFDSHGIAVDRKIQRFLQPLKGSSWILLQTFAQYYNKKQNIAGFGETFDLWNGIYASLYYQKYKIEKYGMKPVYPYITNSVSNYLKGVSFKKWSHEDKLNFFMSIFGFDGTDEPFREFYIRYEPYNKNTNSYFNNIVPILLETFLDLYDINLLPFFSRIINFREYSIPLLNPDLELRLLSGRPVMPAIDFNINPADLQIRSRERDLRQFSPLMLLLKIKKMYVNVKFMIETPIDLTGHCLYLNNNCYHISEHGMKLQLLAGVYSAYIVEEIDNNLYTSEVTYHTVAKNTQIRIVVKEINESKQFLPLVYYTIDAKCFNDEIFLKLFINYKDMTIRIQQFTDEIHYYFENELYYSMSLERNGISIFEHEFFGLPQNKQPLINEVHKFEVGDQIHFYHREPGRMQISLESFSNESENNTFLFTNTGLQSLNNEMELQTVTLDIKRIDRFNKDYYVDLSYNTMYQVYLARYIRLLLNNEMGVYIPTDWYSLSNYIL